VLPEGWGAAQMVEHLPNNLKALSYNPSTKKEKKKGLINGVLSVYLYMYF
jgi:hypothetical protein